MRNRVAMYPHGGCSKLRRHPGSGTGTASQFMRARGEPGLKLVATLQTIGYGGPDKKPKMKTYVEDRGGANVDVLTHRNSAPAHLVLVVVGTHLSPDQPHRGS